MNLRFSKTECPISVERMRGPQVLLSFCQYSDTFLLSVPLQMKAQIDEKLPYLQTLKPENPGSKWPKVSLAALRDGKRLSFEQLLKLKSICRYADFHIYTFSTSKLLLELVRQLTVKKWRCLSKSVHVLSIGLRQNQRFLKSPEDLALRTTTIRCLQ